MEELVSSNYIYLTEELVHTIDNLDNFNVAVPVKILHNSTEKSKLRINTGQIIYTPKQGQVGLYLLKYYRYSGSDV